MYFCTIEMIYRFLLLMNELYDYVDSRLYDFDLYRKETSSNKISGNCLIRTEISVTHTS